MKWRTAQRRRDLAKVPNSVQGSVRLKLLGFWGFVLSGQSEFRGRIAEATESQCRQHGYPADRRLPGFRA